MIWKIVMPRSSSLKQDSSPCLTLQPFMHLPLDWALIHESQRLPCLLSSLAKSSNLQTLWCNVLWFSNCVHLTTAPTKQKYYSLCLVSLALHSNELKASSSISITALCSDYFTFRPFLEVVYFDHTCQITVINKISFLYQTKLAAIYAFEFMSLANTLNLDNNTKLLQFQ